MAKKQQMSRTELSQILSEAVERKTAEREAIINRAFDDADRTAYLLDMAEWLKLEIKYCEAASAYYMDDFEKIATLEGSDLVASLDVSDLAPKAYADYLRTFVSADGKEQEKLVHAALKGFKLAMKDTVEMLHGLH